MKDPRLADQRSSTFPSVMVKNEMNLNVEGFNCDDDGRQFKG